jgi:hypothetical protein
MGQLYDFAEVVKNETTPDANSAQRIGNWMELAATAIETLPSALNFFDFASSGVTTGSQNVFVPLNATVTQGFQRNGISVASDGLISYTGSAKQFQFSFIISFLGAVNRKIHAAMFKNNALWPCSEFVAVIPSGAEVTIPSQCVIPLLAGDTLQVRVKCSTHELSITLDNINVIIKEL